MQKAEADTKTIMDKQKPLKQLKKKLKIYSVKISLKPKNNW